MVGLMSARMSVCVSYSSSKCSIVYGCGMELISCRNSVRYTYTGNTTVGHTNYPVNFDVTPTEVFAVA
jgi:hypothetical protein